MVSAEATRRNDERLGWGHQPFPYLVRVIELPPTVAQAGFEASRRARFRGDGSNHRWSVDVTGGRLELQGDGRVSTPPAHRYGAYRAVPAAIRSHWWHRAVSVLVELAPWSKTRTALGLGIRRRPFLTGDGVYLELGAEALEALGAEIEAWGLHELHELEGWLGSLSAGEPRA